MDFISNMANLFKNIPKKKQLAEKRKEWVAKLEQPISVSAWHPAKPAPSIQAPGELMTAPDACDSKINHPIAGPGLHHYHDTAFHGTICCKCGMDKNIGKKISAAKLREVRKDYW